MATQTTADSDVARSRARYGVWVILIGVGGLVGALVAVLFEAPNATGGTILGIIASPIAAIVASYFGISAARAASEEAGAAKAEAGLTKLDKDQSIDIMTSKVEEAARSGPVGQEEAARLGQQARDEAQS